MLYRYLLLFLFPILVSSSTAFLWPPHTPAGGFHPFKGVFISIWKALFLLLTLYLVNSFSTFNIQFKCHSLSLSLWSLSKDYLHPSALVVNFFVFPKYAEYISMRILVILDWMRLSHFKLPVLNNFRPIKTKILHDLP